MGKAFRQILVILIVSLLFGTTISNSYAEEHKEVNLQIGKKLMYPKVIGNWSTNYATIDGHPAYCLQASKNTPKSQLNARAVIENNPQLLKVLYYGYGGPGNVFKGDGDTEEHYFLNTHILASYAYDGDLHGLKSFADLTKMGVALEARWNQIQALPLPSRDFNLNNQTDLQLKAYQEGGVQRTPEIKLNAGKEVAISLNLPAGVRLFDQEKKEYYQGTVRINGGSSFYLVAPLSQRGQFNSGELAGNDLMTYAPLVIKTDASHQDMGTLSIAKDKRTLKLGVNWLNSGSLEITKVNDGGILVDGSEFLLRHLEMDFKRKVVVTGGRIKVDDLPVGNYLLEEIKAPYKHIISTKEVPFVIKENQVTRKTIINRLKPTGRLIIRKEFQKNDPTEMNLEQPDFSKVCFKLVAGEEIIDQETKQVIYQKNQEINPEKDRILLVRGTHFNQGNYGLDQEGYLEITGLPLGKYLLKERQTAKGYLKDPQEYSFIFKQENFKQTEYVKSETIVNKSTKVIIKKQDAKGQKLGGALLQIKDLTGQVVKEYTSSEKDQVINGLEEGKIYQIIEKEAPEGLVKAKAISFKVTDQVNNISLIDGSVSLLKLDQKERKLAGASLVVKDSDGRVIDRWLSGRQIINLTADEKEKLKQTGLLIKENWGVKKEGDSYLLKRKENNRFSYYYIDIEGKETKHLIRNLQAGQKYWLQEEAAPQGYSLASKIEFTANDKQQELKLINHKIVKTDDKYDIGLSAFFLGFSIIVMGLYLFRRKPE